MEPLLIDSHQRGWQSFEIIKLFLVALHSHINHRMLNRYRDIFIHSSESISQKLERIFMLARNRNRDIHRNSSHRLLIFVQNKNAQSIPSLRSWKRNRRLAELWLFTCFANLFLLFQKFATLFQRFDFPLNWGSFSLLLIQLLLGFDFADITFITGPPTRGRFFSSCPPLFYVDYPRCRFTPILNPSFNPILGWTVGDNKTV